MGYLDPASLYSLRQSSGVFCRLFGDNTFIRHHSDARGGIGWVPFATGSLAAPEQLRTARSLQRDMYCSSCLKIRNGPDWDARLADLQGKLYCDGCETHHLRFLFFPESIENHKRGVGKLLCVGRLGRVTLCSHSTSRTTTTWRMIDSMRSQPDKTVCTHPSHSPLNGTVKSKRVSPCPRLSLSRYGGVYECTLAYGWDLPLLKISQLNIPSLEAVREALTSQVTSGFPDHRVCKHITRGGYLRSFVWSGTCPCFSQRGRYIHPFSENSRDDCFCDRERYLNCKDCGAIFSWFLDAGRVVLMHRYVWNIHKPTSAAWLSLLDEGSYRDKLFRENIRQ